MPYNLEPEQPKSTSITKESLHRVPAQATAGAAATLPGIFGDVLSLPYAGVNKLVSSLGGTDVPYEESSIGKLLPTTEMHKKALQEGIPYLKPKNKIESFANDVASDAISLFLPGGSLKKAGLRSTNLARSFATSLGANSAGSFVSDLTGDPEKGAYTKLGSMFLLSALNKPGVQKELGNLYQKADSLLPKNATVNSERLEKQMNDLKNRILNGRQASDLAASEKFVINEADTILRQIEDGQSNVGTLRSAIRSLNENLEKAVYEAPSKSTRTRARKLATQINRNVRETLADYGKQNPEWWKLQQAADQGTATFHQSNFITRFIENNVKHGTVAHGILHALGVGFGTAGFVPYQSAKTLYQITKSPTLARHYARVVSSAAAENASLMNQEIKSLEEAFEKEKNKKSKYKLED